MYFKKLVGKRLYLSPIDKDDCIKYTEWLNDMDVSITLNGALRVFDVESEKIALEELKKIEYNFAIVDINKDELIGNVGFLPKVDYINGHGEVGIFIGNKAYWNNGYGTEALTLLLDFGFNILNLNSISLRVYSYNNSARNCYKKVGFKEVGRLREAKIIGGNKYDIIYMDILASEFKSPYIKFIIDRKKNFRY